MSDVDDDELQELREDTEITDRASAQGVTFESDEFVDTVVSELQHIDSGGSKTYSARDKPGMALLKALEEHPKGQEVLVDGLEDVLETEVDDLDRSQTVRLLVRAGLVSSAPELLESLKEAVGRHAASSV